MKVLVDPYVVAVPPLNSTTDRIVSYINGIETWIDAAAHPFLGVLYDSECVNYLLDSDTFPFPQRLKQLFSSAGITGYDANTVFASATNIFRSWVDIRSIFRIATFTGHITVSPVAFVTRISKDLSDVFVDCLGKLIVQKDAGDPEFDNIHIGSADCVSSSKMEIQGTITDILVDNNEITFPTVPIQIFSNLNVLLDFEDILRSAQWDIVCQYPTLAVEKAYYSVVQRDSRDIYRLGNYKVGANFLRTLTSLGFPTQRGRIRSTYETCALVICGRASELTGINPRRLKGRGRTTDGAKGMRADISQYKAGYRLHYWKCPDGSIELSCVNVHNDVTIY